MFPRASGTRCSPTKPFDPAAYLVGPDAIASYITDAFEGEDPAFIADALGVVASGISEIAREVGVSRESLYRALSAEGNPQQVRH